MLRHYNATRPSFIIANEMAKTMRPKPWKRERLAAARKALLDHRHITLVRKAYTDHAAVYAWAGVMQGLNDITNSEARA